MFTSEDLLTIAAEIPERTGALVVLFEHAWAIGIKEALAAKNAVLIVEFAKRNFDHGLGLREAVAQAARQRLRPIVMTSLAFCFGVLPLAIANGAGSGAQNAVGTGVIGGMLASTFLAIFFVPVFFVTVLRWFKVRRVAHAPSAAAEPVPVP